MSDYKPTSVCIPIAEWEAMQEKLAELRKKNERLRDSLITAEAEYESQVGRVCTIRGDAESLRRHLAERIAEVDRLCNKCNDQAKQIHETRVALEAAESAAQYARDEMGKAWQKVRNLEGEKANRAEDDNRLMIAIAEAGTHQDPGMGAAVRAEKTIRRLLAEKGTEVHWLLAEAMKEGPYSKTAASNGAGLGAIIRWAGNCVDRQEVSNINYDLRQIVRWACATADVMKEDT